MLITLPKDIPSQQTIITAIFNMAVKEGVVTKDAPSSSFLSQAVKCNGMVYCAGSIGMDPKTNKMVEGTIADRTVR